MICNAMREKKKAVTEDQWQGFQISCYPIRTNLLESSPVLKLEMGSWPFTGTNMPPPTLEDLKGIMHGDMRRKR